MKEQCCICGNRKPHDEMYHGIDLRELNLDRNMNICLLCASDKGIDIRKPNKSRIDIFAYKKWE